jgi:adenine-specific DNA-methyltransferase
MAYLKVLMDEIFGRDGFINTISVNMKNIAGASGGGEDTRLKKNIEYIHLYCKDYDSISFKSAYDLIPIEDLVENYREEDKSWKYTSVLYDKGEKEYLSSTVDGDGNEIKIYYRHNPVFKSINQIINEENISEKEAYSKYALQIFQTQMPQSSIRPRVMKKVQELKIKHDFFSIEYVPKTGRNKGKLYEQFYKGDNFRLLAWLSDVSEEIDGVLYKKEMQGTYWDFASATKNLAKEGKVLFPNGKKPESLIQRILEMTTEEGDLVLDIFGGSGTSFAVAHKMKRKWIGVELGDHADTHIIPRMLSIISGEDNSGVSELVKWQGGGSFKYYHLGESIINIDKETGKGEFNWSLGKQFIQESLLVSYNFIVQKDIDVFPTQIFKDNNSPTVGKLLGTNNKSIYGLSFLVAPSEKDVTISNDEIKSIYNVVRKQADFHSLVIYTNKGIDISQDAMPDDMDIIKVPHAIFAELER